MSPQEKSQLELPIAQEVSLARGLEGREMHVFSESLLILAKRKSFIFWFVTAVALLAAGVSLLLPKYYTADARVLPAQQSQSAAVVMLGQLGGLSTLLGAGKDIGNNLNKLSVSMLRSRTVADKLINRFSLMALYRAKRQSDARQRLASLTEINDSTDSIITIAVQDRDPQRAADIANAYIEELNKLTNTLAVANAGKRRAFYERETKAASDALGAAELALRQTEERTGIIEVGSQARVMLQAYAELRAQAVAKEVQIQAMRSFATVDNPDLVRAENELAALRAQLAGFEKGQGGSPVGDVALEKVPSRALEYFQKLREMKYREALFELLARQYEAARVDEAREMPMIQILDKAIPPEIRSFPKRTLLVLVSTFLAMLIAIGTALLLERIQRLRRDRQFMTQFKLFRYYLSWRTPNQPEETFHWDEAS